MKTFSRGASRPRQQPTQQEEEQKREKLLEASQDKLVMEELEKKEKEQYHRLFQKREQINIDDISTITYNYRQKRQR